MKQKDAFLGAAEELSGITSGTDRVSRSSNHEWWTSELA